MLCVILLSQIRELRWREVVTVLVSDRSRIQIQSLDLLPAALPAPIARDGLVHLEYN